MNKALLGIFFIVFISLALQAGVVGCSSGASRENRPSSKNAKALRPRQVSDSEMQKFGLIGVVHHARICPTKFEEISKAHQVVGKCEIFDCDVGSGKLQCWALPE